MSTSLPEGPPGRKLYVDPPDISHIQIEDDTPVEGIYTEKQARLLAQSVYASWVPPDLPTAELELGGDAPGAPRPFAALTDVGLFGALHESPLVPDFMLSLDVRIDPACATEKRHNTYFIWEMGKPPELVVEIVSNKTGEELARRKLGFARWRVDHYVVWDPAKHLGGPELRAFVLTGGAFLDQAPQAAGAGQAGPRVVFPRLGLQLAPWFGAFEGVEMRWLRFFDLHGRLLETGDEKLARAEVELAAERQKAETERQKAEAERQKAETERQKAEAERDRAERLAAKLRALGLDPDALDA